jgi:UDP-4-amino-4,6-dideoxy-N-acetyl-beta-L-altrosamine N-acetyltransferase
MVSLRELTREDSSILLSWRNLPEIRKYMYTDHTISQEEHDHWFEGIWGDETRKYWVIVLDGEDVGLVNLYDINKKNRRCSWAFYLASPNVRGKGVGKYVEYTVLRYVFEELGFNKLCCEVLTSNMPVVEMHESYGFVRESYYREHILRGTEFNDVIGLGFLKRDWEIRKAGIKERLQKK